MKTKFSTSWKSSKQPRKQRKYLANAPLHLRKKFVASNLSKELRKKYGRRSIGLRKEDTVKIMRGKFRKKTGKVLTVDLKKLKVTVEGIQRTKKDGSKIPVKLHPSALQITALNINDKERLKQKKNEMEKTTKSKNEQDKKVKENAS